MLVKLSKHQQEGKHLEGKVIKVLSPLPVETGWDCSGKKWDGLFVVSDDPAIDDILYSQKQNNEGHRPKGGDQRKRRAQNGKSPEGKITEILGRAGDAGIDILHLRGRFGLVTDFPDCGQQAL